LLVERRDQVGSTSPCLPFYGKNLVVNGDFPIVGDVGSGAFDGWDVGGDTEFTLVFTDSPFNMGEKLVFALSLCQPACVIHPTYIYI